jgi:hypothetical protein
MAKKPKTDQPFDDKEAEFIRIIADGGTWATACEQLRVSSATLSKWLREDAELQKQYAHAREAQGDIYADRVIDTAIDKSLDPAEKRVRMDAYKWAAGKRKPKVYGDKLAIGGDPDSPLQTITRIELVAGGK